MACWHWGEDHRNLPSVTLTQLFQVLVEGSQGIRLCLLGTPSHFLGTYVGNLILATLSPRSTFRASAQLDSPCTTQLSTVWAQSMGEKNKAFLEWVKKESEWKQLFLPQFHLCKGSIVFVALMVKWINLCLHNLPVTNHRQNKNTSFQNLELSLTKTYEAPFNITLTDIPALEIPASNFTV